MEEKQKITFLDQLKEWVLVFIVVGFIAIIGNIIGYGHSFLDSLPGMTILMLISVTGLALNYLSPKIPSVLFISLIGLLIAAPFSPLSETVIYWTTQVELLALATPILAYAGVVVGRDWKGFTTIGWRGLLVALLVLVGTFLVSGGIAEIMQRFFY